MHERRLIAACVGCAVAVAALQNKYFVHPSMTVLHEPRSALRKLLSIRDFDPKEVICLVRVRAGC